MSIQTLVVSQAGTPSVLVLCPTEDFGQRRTCRVVPIWLGLPEAHQVGSALEGIRLARPMTHDLFLDALTNLDASVVRAEIVDQRGRMFFARLVLSCRGREISLDARPSDAISLAIRQGAVVLMDDDVLNRASFPFMFRSEKPDEDELAEFHEFIEGLNPDDFLDA